MKSYSVFDIMGPIMIGPSSSHTAGAARLAKLAAKIAEGNVKEVIFMLHGSFSKTYRGHGTDRALVAGILGMDPWDENLRNSFNIAEERGLKYKFEEADLGDVHPNTVKFIMTDSNGVKTTVTGSSIGGGNIVIFELDGQSIQFTGAHPTIIINNLDVPGMIYRISNLLFENNINIASMNVYRKSKGSEATTVIETDGAVPATIIDKIRGIEHVNNVEQILPPVKGE
ncbi:L-serine ammonia-lyase, iron-sulfur-dependent subunit beta [Clostridium culturomicium]|uniref:L-serine ammonia-lyase, iron-sulfur-dependent subunit beta n=1 Tax=Clostridium culturomicium TaxID=1499683 RepID=UPI00058F6012|nr:L-serine ammonia-lyase, iron-sulfur-dependent subunit beta [Clostridium culturomicium]